MEELKNLPSAAVWDYFCNIQNVPCGLDYMDAIQEYEKIELSKRM
jgi:L-rhamnose isomerase